MHDYHYIKISCVCVRSSVTEGQWKRFDLETQSAVSLAVERKRLHIDNLCEHQSRYYVAIGTNIL